MRRYFAALVVAMALPLQAGFPNAALAQQVVVRSGETLSEIADRHGVSLRRLMQANGISDPDLVVIGQRLTIPGGQPSNSGSGSVTVQPGETLSEISERHGVSLRSLMQANGISDPDLVVTGQRLRIPGGTANTSTQPTAPYTVKSGETLSEIADRFKTSTDRLIRLNGISDPDLVVSGTRLRIPMPPRQSSQATSRRPAVNRQAKEHVVRAGENLSTIASLYGTSVANLVALNRLDNPEKVVVGQRIKLRGKPPVAAKPAPKPTAKTTTKPKPKPAAVKPSQPQETITANQPAPKTASQPPAKATAPQAEKPVVSAPIAKAKTTTSPASTSEASPAPKPKSKPEKTAATPSRAPETTQRPAVESKNATPTAKATIQTTPSDKKRDSSTTKPAVKKTNTAASSTPSKAKPKGQGGDWRDYGPLQVDWSKLQSMGGSYVAPSLNGKGEAMYLAVNCAARKINVTSQAGQWKTWETPREDFEKRLVQDICKAKGG